LQARLDAPAEDVVSDRAHEPHRQPEPGEVNRDVELGPALADVGACGVEYRRPGSRREHDERFANAGDDAAAVDDRHESSPQSAPGARACKANPCPQGCGRSSRITEYPNGTSCRTVPALTRVS